MCKWCLLDWQTWWKDLSNCSSFVRWVKTCDTVWNTKWQVHYKLFCKKFSTAEWKMQWSVCTFMHAHTHSDIHTHKISEMEAEGYNEKKQSLHIYSGMYKMIVHQFYTTKVLTLCIAQASFHLIIQSMKNRENDFTNRIILTGNQTAHQDQCSTTLAQ